MQLKIPPVFVVLVFATAMYFLDRWLPVGEFDFFGRDGLIWVLAGGSLLVSLLALAQFVKHKTTLRPGKPEEASTLVTGGVFKYSRNPMYLGMLLLLLAWGLWLGNAFNTLLAALFVGYMNHFQIKPEEKALEARFGKPYRNYLIQTRRWF